MQKRKYRIIVTGFMALLVLVAIFSIQVTPAVHAQLPTVSVPTVTGTPRGVIATVKFGLAETVNVRAGPNTVYYRILGLLIPGQEVPAVGKSVAGDYIVIEYPTANGGVGWVWSTYLSLSPGELPVIEPPPTEGPMQTATIDPTLAAQFVVTAEPTRLPTFTAPAPLVIPTFTDASGATVLGKIPVGLIILVVAGLGVLIGVLSLLQRD